MSNSKLDDLRRDIDALDSELLKLFQQRAEKAAEIYKAKGEGSPWRPAREAEHLRELCNQVRSAGGALTEQRVRRIWRAIYADSVASQSRLTIYATKELEIPVRKHFGNDIDFSQKQNTEEVLNAVNSADSSAVAAITLKDWQFLLQSDGLFVHEALHNDRGVYTDLLIAKRPPEASGQDCTLIAVQGESEKAARDRSLTALQTTGVSAWSFLKGNENSSWFLLVLEGWCTPEELKGVEDMRHLGVLPYRGKILDSGLERQ